MSDPAEPTVLECCWCGDDVIDGEGYACPAGYECEACAAKYDPFTQDGPHDPSA
jgi:hypothetical protein